jgi:hypothetical protein
MPPFSSINPITTLTFGMSREPERRCEVDKQKEQRNKIIRVA